MKPLPARSSTSTHALSVRLGGRLARNLAEQHRQELSAVVAERDAQQKVLLEREELLLETEQLATVGSWKWDLHKNSIHVSDEFCRILGVAPDAQDVSFELYFSRVHRADAKRVAALITKALQTKEAFMFDQRIVRPGGEVRLIRTKARVETDPNGQPARIAGVALDITDREAAAAKLRRKEIQLEEAQKIARIASWDFSPQMRTTTWSDELYRIAGITRASVPPSQDAYVALIHPEDRDGFQRAIDEWMEQKNPRMATEHRLVRPDGEIVHVLLQAVTEFNTLGQVGDIVGVVQDITARKHAEESLRLSQERFTMAALATTDVIWDYNPIENVVWHSEAYQTLFGYPRTEDGMREALHWYANIHPDDLAQVEASFEHAIAAGDALWSKEYRFRSATGEWKDVFDRGYLIRDADGNVIRMIGATMEITERKRAVHELARVARLKDEFVSTVSHELRTPLTAIRGAVGLLATGHVGIFPPKAQRLLDVALINTNRLAKLINDILDIERMDSGTMTITPRPTAIDQLIADAVAGVRPLLEEAGIEAIVAADPCVIDLDPDRILQTLTNLLSNAIKFSPAGSTIHISAERNPTGVTFRVRDEGRGVPADKLELIFERFQQVDASDSRDKGGSGLGLAICRSIVRQHGGEIHVASDPGRGSTFTFNIPTPATHATRQAGLD